MSAIANLVAYDGASTPVQHTLLPVSVTRDKGKVVAEWRENASGVPLISQVTARVTLERTSKTGVYRAETRVAIPVQEVVTGSNSSGYSAQPKNAYVNTVVVTGFFHERSDAAGRRLARQLAVNIAGGVTSTVTPSTTGPVPDLVDLLNAPT